MHHFIKLKYDFRLAFGFMAFGIMQAWKSFGETVGGAERAFILIVSLSTIEVAIKMEYGSKSLA